jgi:hypothetical protein
MSHRIRTSRGAILVLLAAITGAHAASAVVVTNPVAPHVYAVSYINEEWTQAPANGGLSGFFDNKEQLEGTDAITSSQKAGTDAIPNPSCAPPCTAMTAKATASYVGGAVVLSASSHTSGNFDAVVTVGEPPDQSYLPGYNSGNIVRAESNATVYDLLTVTAPVQLDLQGHVSGDVGVTISSDSEVFAIPNVDYGSGRADANVNITLVPTPIVFATYNLVGLFLQGFDPSTPFDQDFSATTPLLAVGDYLLKAEFRTTTRIGNVNNPNLAVQDMHSDFGNTATFRLVADVPEAVTSASGLLTFAPEASADALAVVAASALALIARRRRA